MGLETGNEFGSDDVVGGFTTVLTLGFWLLQVSISFGLEDIKLLFYTTMSGSDDTMSSSESIPSNESSESISSGDTSDEMEVVGRVEPYADEPLAHTGDEEEDVAEDLDGLSPAVLRARFEGETNVNEWSVFFPLFFRRTV